jgi:glycosyltransferase involved in cell wall biosynthesis
MQIPGTIREIVDAFPPDAIIAYNSHVYESLAIKSLSTIVGNIPLLLELEDMPLARKREWASLKPRLDQLCWNGLVKRASGFTAVNEAILNMLPDKPKVLLPGVIDSDLVRCASTRRSAFSRPVKTLGYFGSLSPDKGVQVLLDIMPQLTKSWRLLVTGSGPLTSKFIAAAAESPDRLTFLGSVPNPELYPAMCSCDCTLIPRERVSDGGNSVFPFKALEYLVAGTHVIASGIAKFKETMDWSFVDLWDGEPESLLGVLDRSEQKYRDRSEQREKAVRQVIERYTADQVAESILGILTPQLSGLSR